MRVLWQKQTALSVQNWAIHIEMSGFLRETTTSQRQHVFLKSISLGLLCVFSIKHSHRYPKISYIFYYILHIKCTRWIIFEQNNPATENQFKWSLNWMKLGVLSSLHQQCMWLNLNVVMIKTNGTSCTKLYHSLRSIGVSTGNIHITSATYCF